MAMIPTDLTIDPALRPQAKILLSKTRKDIQEMEAEEVLKTIHIFQLRLIELTVQNEALRCAQSDEELSRKQYCNLFDFAPVGYLMLDEDGAIIKANNMAASFLGGEVAALKKQNFSKFISAESQDAYHLHYRDACRTGHAKTCELQLANNDSLRIQVSSHMMNAPDPIYLTTISDITDVR